MTPEQLRASILQYAMQGKLTDQREEDGSVDDLLAQISAEKERLISDKKIKRDKVLPPISEDEFPFQIPANWKWVRLSDAFDVRDGTHDTPKYQKSGFPLVTSKNISSGKISLESVKYISEEDFHEINRRSKVSKGDILFAMIGTVGNPVIIGDDTDFAIKNLALFKNTFNLNSDYLNSWLQLYQKTILEQSSGGVQKFVSLKYLRALPVPLPPLAEQERIVDMIEMLETQINDYTRQYEKIQLLDKELMPKLKESILHEIVSGNINRDATDEPFDSQINTPFEVPANWHWTTLSEIAEISLGKTPDSKNTRYWGGEFPWISISDMQNGRVLENTQKQITQAAIDEKMGAISPKGTLILSFKLSIGKVAILPTDMYHNEDIASIFITDSTVLKEWLYVILPEMVKYADVAGAVKGNTLNKKKLSNLLVPLPDIETQQKLVQIWLSALEYM
ncbi:restriction endonuclease subunit S [Weissella confusa]|uniref:restriction endonuclease subunit S n=1 Tax=Weissella confusa TaxID=1583 RepID=UPI0018F255B6|nr:restriction endonuclease subunit S [Weissella confusa]MBJ7683156.1 restriction endonuclease subunit S [Weissella confusa]MBJ7703916.1 restriction endonuclease subunit S [Weissella confusa]